MRRWLHGRWLMVPPAALAFLAAAGLLAMALGLPFGSLPASADEEKPAATPAAEGQVASEEDVRIRNMPLGIDTGNYWEIIEGFEDGWPGIWSVFDNNGTANGEYYWWPKTWEAHSGAYKGWPAGGGLHGYNSHTSGGARYLYPYYLDSWMVSPAIDLTNAVEGDISFWMSLETELNWDYCGVYASRNSVNYYGVRTSGNTGGYLPYDYDIANWPGLGNLLGDSSVWFAFICTSDGSINRSAMYLDDIDLQVTLVCDEFSDPHGTCYPSTPFDRTNWPAKWAIDEPLDPDLSCTPPYYDSIWYHFQAPCTGTAEVDTFGSNYDTVLGVFSGGSPGTERACSDDAGGLQSQVFFPITAGVTYHVLAGTFDSGVGATLRLHGEVRCEQIAEVKITGQGMLNPPSSIPVNQSVNLTLRKIIHNNGPNGPAPVTVTTTAGGPGDCTLTGPIPFHISLPVSVSVTVDEIWTVRCSQASTHTFTFNNSVRVDPPWTDPVPGNNSASTQFSVALTGSADVAIASQSVVNPPSQIQCNTPVQVTLRKDIVNYGPYTPVDVNISTQGVAPAGCTITTPASIAPQKVDMTANATVDELWIISCWEPGSKTFTFNNAISVTTPHVSDPIPGNNTWSTQLPVNVVCLEADLIETAVSDPPASQNRGTSFSVTDTVRNQGAVAAGPSRTRYYLSLDALRNAGDKLLIGFRSVPALPPGATSTGTKSVKIPGNTPLDWYYLLACADDTLLVPESDENNNCIASARTIQVTAPDLKVTVVSNPPGSVARGGSFNVTDTTANVGTGTAGASTTQYYLSLDKTKGATDALLTGSRAVPVLAAGANSSGTVLVTVPLATPLGTYYLLACADDLKVVKFEIKEGNNCRASASRVQITP